VLPRSFENTYIWIKPTRPTIRHTPSYTIWQPSDTFRPSYTICTIFTIWHHFAVSPPYTIIHHLTHFDHHTPSDTLRPSLYNHPTPSYTIWQPSDTFRPSYTIWHHFAVSPPYTIIHHLTHFDHHTPSDTLRPSYTIFTIWHHFAVSPPYTIIHHLTHFDHHTPSDTLRPSYIIIHHLTHFDHHTPSSPSDNPSLYNHPTPSYTIWQPSDTLRPSYTIFTIRCLYWTLLAINSFALWKAFSHSEVPFSPV
jgi:uncharacterized protein (DUF983 family)